MRALLRRARDSWERLLASPGGPSKVALGIAAGAAAAMLPAFGLHLIFAAGFAWALRGSLPVAAATCLTFGNPLTHAVLLPTEYAIGRVLLPPSVEFLPEHGPAWLMATLPAAEETLVGGLVLAVVVGSAAYAAARRWGGSASPNKPDDIWGGSASPDPSAGVAGPPRTPPSDSAH
ncbi:DUF2062 domain-containing protein [Teichococcus cervicalis]|uniref:DUF2062 domain-containing protein n=1 Tax=Pseudoroseomonas cervicalis ATCC 49957 TaxID=525371 RepID=D5RLL0_9PROT|nr:DUF2062 domain-containing protein [Pseudoroseomonas cervicalis]EFH11809.1 hypothetical protein HMPREF0731_1971 [Pseudoroseomonas cervicalis ATCC 49957]